MRPYFAYGSNLHAADWRAWCARKGFDPDSIRPRERAFLPDHRLVFDFKSHTRNGGVCNLTPAPGAFVEGWLFDVAEEGWAALDEKESVGIAYHRADLIALNAAGDEIPITTYLVGDERRHGFTEPTLEYLDIVLTSRRALGLSTDEIEHAVKNTHAPPPDFFIYGTLLPGEANHHRLTRHGLLRQSQAVLRGALHDLGPFPAMTLAPTHDVQGERVTLHRHAEAVADLDELEDFIGFAHAANLYRRTLVDLAGARVWTYVLAGPTEAPVIASGCWRTHRAAAI